MTIGFRAPRKLVLFALAVLGATLPAWAVAAEANGELVVSRGGGGAYGGAVEVRLDGLAWGELAGKAPLFRTLSPGRYQVTFRLLNSSGGAGVFGVEPLEYEVQVQGGRQTSLTLLLVPEALGTVLKVTEKG